jgi:DMSO/TMAO reductase YedYZ molybdopterin-dependent catalytic subunit
MTFAPTGFTGRDGATDADLPPGQYATQQFPVVSIDSTPPMSKENWAFTLTTEHGQVRRWDWVAMRALPSEQVCVDLHSVTGWSKLATNWEGVSVHTLFESVSTTAEYALVHTYGEYTTNLPLEDLLEMPSWIAFCYEGHELSAEHGGPARLLVPHLYLWKSAKWVRGITLSDQDQPGTRERQGYHNYGDPWRQQRYQTTDR